MRKVENSYVMSIVNIRETYPDEYILIKLFASNHNQGVPLYIAPTRDELVEYINANDLLSEVMIVAGERLIPVLGGFLV